MEKNKVGTKDRRCIEWLGRAPPRSKVSKEVTFCHVDFWGKGVPSRVNSKCIICLVV